MPAVVTSGVLHMGHQVISASMPRLSLGNDMHSKAQTLKWATLAGTLLAFWQHPPVGPHAQAPSPTAQAEAPKALILICLSMGL